MWMSLSHSVVWDPTGSGERPSGRSAEVTLWHPRCGPLPVHRGLLPASHSHRPLPGRRHLGETPHHLHKVWVLGRFLAEAILEEEMLSFDHRLFEAPNCWISKYLILCLHPLIGRSKNCFFHFLKFQILLEQFKAWLRLKALCRVSLGVPKQFLTNERYVLLFSDGSRFLTKERRWT